MGKVKGKQRKDKYYTLAKEHGYRSRASFKLLQIDDKFDFLRSSRSVLDLCAAPGGWMQIAVQRAPVGSLVLGIDLVRIAPLRGAVSFEQDITKPECKTQIKKVMGEHGVKAFDLVLHDGSPNIGGAWAQEAVAQNALVIDSLKLATQFLVPKGVFVTKVGHKVRVLRLKYVDGFITNGTPNVFRSLDYNAVRYCLSQLFEKVEVYKPAASRLESAEIFLVGLKYKAPAKIDPRILDVKHLFESSADNKAQVEDVLGKIKQKRSRGGYEDGATVLRKVVSATDFIWSETPLEILGSVSSIVFVDPSSLLIRDHELTTGEVKALCDDLRVLGKQDFKHLLKWRIHMRKALSPQKADSTIATENEHKNEDKSEEDEDDRILNEMEEMTHAIERKKKREKKILAKRRAKEKARKSTGMQIDALQDGYTDQELFSLTSIKGKKDLVAVDAAEYDNDGELRDSENEENDEEMQDKSSSDMDSDEERRRYDERMEELLDQAYERFVASREGSTKQRKRAKQAHEQLLEGDDDEPNAHSDYESDKDEADEANPLMVPLSNGKLPTQKEITDMWFGQNIFTEALEEGVMEKNDSEEDMRAQDGVGDLDMHETDGEIQVEGRLHDIDSDHEIQRDRQVASNAAESNRSRQKASKKEDDFEIVPAPDTDSSDDSSSDSSEEEDVETKAEILAYAKKMLRKKEREQILDDAYNKYMFDDDGLPGWFVNEEKRHRQITKPVTKEEIAAMRAQFKELNARPAKKVAEAKARKKKAAVRKLEKVRKKANAISDQTDLNDRSKRKLIDQLYKKATPQRPKKEFVVAKKGVAVKAGKGKVLVDRRMKKDMRKRGMGKPGKGGGSKKGKNAKVQRGKGSANKGKKGKKMGMQE